MNPLDLFSGYKSYVLGAATILGGVALVMDGKVIEGITAITTGLGLLTARRAVSRVEK